MKALLGDRDALSRHVIVQTLANTSLEICCVTDGAEAWERLNADQPPRLIIVDWMLPKLNGLEICRAIRERAAPDYTYIILLGERSKQSDKLAALDAGADDYVTKPVHQYELLATVQIARRFLGKEDRLTAMVQQWRTMLDHLPFGVACLSRNGNVLRASRVFAELLGQDVKTLIGKSIIPSNLRRAGDLTLLRESMRLSKPFDAAEMQIIRQDGCARMATVWGRPLASMGQCAFQLVTAEV
ncbi:MAG TPA: response regulator [Terriglobales bacterium]|nr:response regulator [Terriglobales bacterium]